MRAGTGALPLPTLNSQLSTDMTAQIGEKLIFNGKETSISFWPSLPDQHPGIIKLEAKDIKYDNRSICSTACWRGYIGTWAIENGYFYLVGLVGQYKMTDKYPILADWFSGTIRVPQGELIYYDRAGFKVYDREIHVQIENGKVIDSQSIDNRDREFNFPKIRGKNLRNFEDFWNNSES
ncbi:MAG: hypothetical protein HC849_00270 [Oscillatoriales cyanobacterium RU_3_3]|nr:hypothetical protein [Oscillatoriales cyanobacterium RU_3_3]